MTSDVSPETYPAKVLFEIYAGGEMLASVGMNCELEEGTIHCTLTPEEEIVLDGEYQREDLFMRVTVTNRQGNEFAEEWKLAEE